MAWQDGDLHFTQHLIERPAGVSDTVGAALEVNRHRHRYGLPLVNLIEIQVGDVPAERMPLDVTDQHLHGVAVDRERDNSAGPSVSG